MQEGSDDDIPPPFTMADVDHVRQALVDDYGFRLIPFLLPAVRARAFETESEGFVPTHPGIAWIMAHPGFRVIAAFDHGEGEQARIRSEIAASELKDGVWHLPLGEKKSVQDVFDYLCQSIAYAIGVAWAEAIYYEVERVTGDEGRHGLCASDIGDDMLPCQGKVFHAVIASGEIHLATALAVLREAQKSLPEGERLPAALSADFITRFD